MLIFYSMRSQPLVKYKSLFVLPLACCLSIVSERIAFAQVIPDATLPNNSQVINNSELTEIIGGTTAGDNLFHSFEQFSLSTGETAFFNNALTIENIIGRVTGGSISDIDGLIKANGTANLFLINPNGIVFGENAALNIGGSFIGSTADSIRFADGSQFSAVNPQAEPLLTVSIPIGLQYGTNPGDIAVRGSGSNLSIDFDTFTIDRSTRPSGLEVKSGETLALIGNNVTLEGGNITASEGRIELGSVGQNESVKLISTKTGWQINYTDVSAFGELTLSDAASIDVSGNGSGDVHLQANSISFTEGSAIVANTLKDGTGGQVTLVALDTIEAIGVSEELFFPSGIKAHVDIDAEGTGSDIALQTKDLSVLDGAQIEAITFGFGDGGNLDIKAQNIKTIGGNEFVPSGLFAYVELFAEGNGGNLTISTNTLQVKEGAQIYTTTFGIGDAGNLDIKAKDIEVVGFDFDGVSIIDSSSDSLAPDLIAEGNGGNLNIITNTLRVAEGGQIATSTSGLGNAGNLNIQAKEIELSDADSEGSSGLFSSALFLDGNGGNINVTTDKLDVKDGAVISASNFQSASRIPPGEGKAGNINIQADLINIDNTDIKTPSAITASTFQAGGGNIELKADNIAIQNNSEITAETQGEGNGGEISLFADSIRLSDGARLSTNTIDAGDGGTIKINADSLQLNNNGTISSNSIGLGQAGNIEVTATNLQTNEGKIVATSDKTGGGNIVINSDFIYIDNNSLISTSVNDSNGGGGNVNINSNSLVANQNSDIRANAVFGAGGNINISTEIILTSFDSDIDASSEFGLDGVVEVTSIETEKQINVIKLPDNVPDTTNLITATCPIKKDNVVVVSGKGGLPENPNSFIRGRSLWQDTRLISPDSINTDLKDSESNSVAIKEQNSQQAIVEAKGWIVNPAGNIELSSHVVNSPTTNSSWWYQSVRCQDITVPN